MVRKSTSGISSRLQQSLSNTSASSTDSVSSAASVASAAARLTTTRHAGATPVPPATDRGTAKLSRVKSLNVNPAARPPPVSRHTRPSLGVAQSLNTTTEVKQTSKPVAHLPMKRRPSIADSAKSAPSEKVPSTSAAVAKKPLSGQPSSAAAAGRPSVGHLSSSATVAKKPLAGQLSSAAVASKPPAGKPRIVVKGVTAAPKFSQRK